VLEGLANQLESLGPVSRFWVPKDSLRAGTFLGLIAAIRLLRRHARIEQVLFLDAHLLLFTACWPFLSRLLPRYVVVSLIYLGGPEPIAARSWRRKLLRRFFRSAGRRLCLRTEELVDAWRTAFPELPTERIDTVPTLEMPDDRDVAEVAGIGDPLRLGVIGQVRPGKSLEWLLPLFRAHPDIGILRVAGAFTNSVHRASLESVAKYPGFDDRFLTEDEMLKVAAEQDYLVALYDDWDPRMEVATVFLAARVGRPVIVYNEGWPGRVVRTFGCGVVVDRNPRPGTEFFMALPRPESTDYHALLAGAARFRHAHGGASSRAQFLSKFLGPDPEWR
jgi:hypothetical protein